MAEESSESSNVPFTLALISGGCAGTTVDVALYPLDTLRTRMQAKHHCAAQPTARAWQDSCPVCHCGRRQKDS